MRGRKHLLAVASRHIEIDYSLQTQAYITFDNSAEETFISASAKVAIGQRKGTLCSVSPIRRRKGGGEAGRICFGGKGGWGGGGVG